MTREQAEAIKYVLQSPGWAHIQEMMDAEIKEHRDELTHLMAKKPDALTGKVALKHAIRAVALEDLKEQIFDSQKILAQSERTA